MNMNASSRISPTAANAVKVFLKPMVAAGTLEKSEAQALSRLLADAAKPMDKQPIVSKPRFLTAGEVAERLGCSTRTVLRMADEGQIKRHFLRPGSHKSLRFQEAEVAAIIEGHGSEVSR